MAFFDLPLHELEQYRPAQTAPADFDSFWVETLAAARSFPLDARFDPIDYGLTQFDTFDVTFNGYGGQPIKGWLIAPKTGSSLPCVVQYIGYGGGRSLPFEFLHFPAAGYITFVMDTRGQGSAGTGYPGDTPDLIDGANAFHPGFMTQGILSPKTYYYRRVFTDAARAIEAARTFDRVDATRIALAGGSQGGGITIAAAALVPDVACAMPEVPFLTDFRRAVTLVDTHPYAEIKHYLSVHRDHVERVFDTLTYFDGMNLASRAKAPALFSVGLMDTVTPPSTIYAAYNHYAGEKKMCVYPFNHHEGGGPFYRIEQYKFLAQHFGGS